MGLQVSSTTGPVQVQASCLTTSLSSRKQADSQESKNGSSEWCQAKTTAFSASISVRQRERGAENQGLSVLVAGAA